MSNNKQSSLELFALALYEGGFLQGNGDEINDLLEHHKAIHKSEIEDAIYWGNIKGYDEHKRTCIHDEDQQYYNETFNPKEK
jgi:hypothetical protein